MQANAPPDPPPAPTRAELFVSFARIAAFAFGGVLPWARYLLVERKRWLTAEEFTDTLALSQLLPGPNIVNMSVAIGARYHGAGGALAALLGLMVLPVAIVLTLAAVYARFAELPEVRGALTGMAAAAAGLIIAMAAKISEPLLRRRFWTAAPFVLLVFCAIGLLRLPLLAVLLTVAPLAVAVAWKAAR